MANVSSAELEDMGLGTGTTGKAEGAPKPAPDNDGSAELYVSVAIRWAVRDAFQFLNMGGAAQVERTVVSMTEGIIRAAAARVEYKTLMGKKLDIGTCVHECFHKEGHKSKVFEVKPWMSWAAGFSFSTVVALIAWLSLGLIPAIIMIALSIGILMSGIKQIPIRSAGVTTVLGERKGFTFSEGIHWTLWPIVDFEIVDLRERVIELKKGEGDNEGNAITVIAGTADNTGTEIPKDLADSIDVDFEKSSGVDVIQVILSEVTPSNQAIVKAEEQIKIEEAEARSEGIEMKHMTERMKALVKEGVPPAEALRMVFRQAGKSVPIEVIVNGAGDLDKLIAGLIAGGTAAAEMKGLLLTSKGSGNGKKDRKHGKDRPDGKQGGGS
jgi:hypothetical protein